MAGRREGSTPAARRTAMVLGAAIGVVAALPLFTWLEREGVVLGTGWVLALLVALAGLTSSTTFQRLLGGGSLNNRLTLRLVVAFSVFAAFSWLAGWSFLLPVSVLLVGVVHVQRSGSGAWRIAAVVATVFTLAGQVGVALGWIPTVLEPARSHAAAIFLLALSLLGVANVGRTAAEREATGRALARTDARLRALMNSSTDVLTVSDSAGTLSYVSPAVQRAMGYAPQRLLGTPLIDLVDTDYRDDVVRRLEEVVQAGPGTSTSLDVLMVHASRERRWYEWTVHNLLDDPLVQGLVVDQRDVTERLLHQDQLAHAAAHDDLTGLANRAELMRRLAGSLPQAAPGAALAVLYLDLDRFKAVNDTFGHAAGDELLVVVAQRLTSCLRPHDHLARLGGDEFCAILTEIGYRDEVRTIAERLEGAVSQPAALSTGVVQIGVSIGSVVTTDGTQDAEALFARADAAMYEVKRSR